MNQNQNSKPAVQWVGTGRYELRNYEFPDRPGQLLQFMVKDTNVVTGESSVMVDGTSVDDVVKVLAHRMGVLDSNEPCDENKKIIALLDEITNQLRSRRRRKDNASLGQELCNSSGRAIRSVPAGAVIGVAVSGAAGSGGVYLGASHNDW